MLLNNNFIAMNDYNVTYSDNNFNQPMIINTPMVIIPFPPQATSSGVVTDAMATMDNIFDLSNHPYSTSCCNSTAFEFPVQHMIHHQQPPFSITSPIPYFNIEGQTTGSPNASPVSPTIISSNSYALY